MIIFDIRFDCYSIFDLIVFEGPILQPAMKSKTVRRKSKSERVPKAKYETQPEMRTHEHDNFNEFEQADIPHEINS